MTAPTHSALHPILLQLFEAWRHEHLHWCVLRMPANTFAPDSDIDLLLDPGDLRAAMRVAELHGFVRLPGRHRGLHLLAYDAQTGTWLWLHCVAELAFGPYQVLRGDPASGFLARHVPSWPPRLSPNDEFWVTLAHYVLDRRRVPLKNRVRLASLANESTEQGAIADGLGRLLPSGLDSGTLLRAAAAGNWETVERVIPALVEAAERHARPGLLQRAVHRIRTLHGRLTQARTRRGISVALLGPDGAGKTTLAQALAQSLVFPVQQLYMGLTGGMLRQVDRLRLPGVVRLGRFAIIWSRYLRAQAHLAQGRVVIFDRYIYDAEVPTPYPLSPAARLGRWLDGRSCPAPDVIIVLDAPGSVMHQRKPTYTPGMMEEWRQRFLGLRERLPNVYVIDGTQPIEEVRNQAMEILWRQYARRWRAR